MTIEYVDLTDYIAIAAAVTGLNVATLMTKRLQPTGFEATSGAMAPEGRIRNVPGWCCRLGDVTTRTD